MNDRELMQQALNLLDDINQCSLPPTGIPLPAEIDHVMEALSARLAQPEPEPVAWMLEWTFNGDERGQRIYDVEYHCLMDAEKDGGVCRPLYTAPPQREWQGLTDEEVRDLWSWAMTAEAERTANTQQHAFARAIEAKLKEKNT